MEEPSSPAANAVWLVLPPSVDRERWLQAIYAAARNAGWGLVSEHETATPHPGYQRIVITDDAAQASAFRPSQIAAIVAEPESAPAALAATQGLSSVESIWAASTLLARALALAPHHRVVTAAELATRPEEIVLFDELRINPPQSLAEFSKDAVLATAFRTYRDVAANQRDVLEWGQELFSYCPKSVRHSAGRGMLDTTGRPRMLVHGPYLALPPGRWRATLRFGVDQDAAKRQYRLDWGTRTATTSEHVTPGAPGVYELTQEFDWPEVDAAEVRLILLEGSFTGLLMFEGLSVRRVGENAPAAAA